MKAEHEAATDLTAESQPVEGEGTELFANLASQPKRTRSLPPPPSGAAPRSLPPPRSQRPPERPSQRPSLDRLANVARLGATVQAAPVGRSVASVITRLPSAAPVVVPVAPAPEAVTQPPTAPARGGRVFRAVLATTVALALAAGVVAVVAGKLSSAAGALLVTVTAPDMTEATGIEVLVDEQKRCSSSPCRVGSLEPGIHFVRARGRGFEETAALAVRIERDSENALNVTLSRAAAPTAAPVAQAAIARVAERPARTTTVAVTTERTELPAVDRTVAGTRSAAPTRRKTEAHPAAPAASAAAKPRAEDSEALGTLRIVSMPISSVLVDGRPIGSTPQIVKVAPGSHRVALVGKEERRVQTVEVAPGGTQVVSVRF